MHLFHRNVALVIAVALASATLAGCSGPEASGPGAADGTKSELRFATPDSGPGAEQLQSVVDAYNKSQDKVLVKLEAYGDAFDQKLTAQIGSGDVPDILKVWNFPAYYKILEPLNDYVNGLKDRQDFYDTLFNYSTMNGKIYGFPTGYSTRAIYYNADLVKRAGITIPENWTSEEYVNTIKSISALGENVFGGDQLTNPDPYAFESFLFSNGGEWLDDNGAPVVNSPENLEVITFLHSVAYGAATGGDVRKHPASEEMSTVFMAGNLGTFEFGKWYTKTFTDNGMSYGILPMFSFNGKTPKSVVHGGFVAVSTNSTKKTEALDFITWMSSYENVTSAAAYDMPIRKSVAKDLGLADNPLNKPFFEMLENSVDTKSSLLKSVKWPDISADIAASLEQIFSNENPDIKKILDELQSRIEAIG